MITSEKKLSPPPQTASCYHCGDPLPSQPVNWADKAFCCQGCQTVFQILAEADMGTYYQLEAHPGSSQSRAPLHDYAYLDSPDIAEQLLSFKDAEQQHVRFSLPAIHCSSCIWLLERLPHMVPGIRHTRVDFLGRTVRIIFSPQAISLRQVAEQLSRLGYPPEIKLDQGGDEDSKKGSRKMALRIGVAGFAFGNIMLMSFPEYLGLTADALPFSQFFGLLNILLALPLILFSAVPFFKGAWTGLQQRYLTIDVPITLGIIALFGRSLFEILILEQAGYMDSLAALVFLLLAGRWFQNRSYDHLAFDRDYKAYFPLAATRLKGKEQESVRITKLQAGDRLLVRTGELIPGDSLLESEKGKLDYSFITGEADPVQVHTGTKVYAGARVIGQSLTLHLLKPVSHSYLTQLWNHESFQKNRPVRIAAFTDLLSRRFTLAVLSIASLAALFWWWQADAAMAVHVFTSVLIVACPCALALTIPVLLGHSLRLLGKKGVYLRHTDVIERLAQITHIVFDKTGTLSTSTTDQQIESKGQLAPAARQRLGTLVAQSMHPVSRGLSQHFRPEGRLPMESFAEHAGKGLEACIDGTYCRLGSQSWLQASGVPLPAEAAAYTWYVEDDQLLAGFRLESRYRPGLRALLHRLGQQFRLALLSGDHDSERSQLAQWFPNHSPLHFGQRPEDKREQIAAWQEQEDARVLMIGDGLNDAGALRQSDVGMAITEGSHSFTPACDLIMEGHNFPLLPELLELSRSSMRLVRIGLVISLMYNVVGLAIAVQGLLSPLIAAILMPLSSITIVLYGVLGSQYLGRIFAQKGTAMRAAAEPVSAR